MVRSLVIVLIASLPAFALGVWFGYEKGVMNHVAYDAPARIALYDAAIRSDDPKEALKSMAISQAKLMQSLEYNGVTFVPLLNLPATKGLGFSYDKYYPVVEKYLQYGCCDSWGRRHLHRRDARTANAQCKSCVVSDNYTNCLTS